jgi:hypothetical protein
MSKRMNAADGVQLGTDLQRLYKAPRAVRDVVEAHLSELAETEDAARHAKVEGKPLAVTHHMFEGPTEVQL